MENKKKCMIRVPLSSANLACGFDSFGIALSLYNTYTFIESDKDLLVGFKSNYLNNNLCLNSYKKVFEKLDKTYIPVTITLDQNIPNCGGLGSSANVIIAGVYAANFMLGNVLNQNELIDIACEIEGHPDNVLPEILGGFTSAIKLDNNIKYYKYKVSESLIFNLYCPSYSLNTKEMREVLPKMVSLSDAIFNLSRTANTPYALENGLYDDLKIILDDKLHQQYRISKLKGSDEIFEYAKKNGLIALISGSGASILVISNLENNKLVKDFNGYTKYELKVDNDGVKIW